MTIKDDNSRDTFRAHVYSRPLSQPGLEMYYAGQNIPARRNRSMSPVIGRDIQNGIGEDYFAIRRQYVVRYEEWDFWCRLTFDTSSYPNPLDWVGIQLELTNSSSVLTVHFVDANGVLPDTETDLYIETTNFEEFNDWEGFLVETVSRINGQFELQGNILLDAYTHAASRPWVADKNQNRLRVTNNLQDESGFAITVLNDTLGVITQVENFELPDRKKRWFKAGDQKLENVPAAFEEGFINDRLQLASSKPRFEKYDGDFSDLYPWIVSQTTGAVSVADLEEENERKLVVDNIGYTETLLEQYLYQDWKRDELINQKQVETLVMDQERWFGNGSTTWTQLASMYSTIGIENAIERMIFTNYVGINKASLFIPEGTYLDNLGQIQYKSTGQVMYHNGTEELSATIRPFDLEPLESIYDVKDHRRGGFMTQDLYEYTDFVDVNDNEYSIFDKENSYAAWLDEPGFDVSPISSNPNFQIELPVSNLEKSYADNYREIPRSSRLDDEMLHVFVDIDASSGVKTPWQPQRRYFRDESIYTDTGRTTDPSMPSQGIIYTNMAR